MKLPENLRDELKIPFGVLIQDKDTNKENISKYLEADSFIITVGDATTEKMLDFQLIPSLQIVDGQEKRVQRPVPENVPATNYSCNNPAGEISDESITTIKTALSSKTPARILVNGEEDLLVLPVCVLAPEKSIVLYGQPNEGLVIVKINPDIRTKAQLILDSMV